MVCLYTKHLLSYHSSICRLRAQSADPQIVQRNLQIAQNIHTAYSPERDRLHIRTLYMYICVNSSPQQDHKNSLFSIQHITYILIVHNTGKGIQGYIQHLYTRVQYCYTSSSLGRMSPSDSDRGCFLLDLKRQLQMPASEAVWAMSGLEEWMISSECSWLHGDLVVKVLAFRGQKVSGICSGQRHTRSNATRMGVS